MPRTEPAVKEGILIRGIGSFYTAAEKDGTEWIVRCKKKFRHQHISPLVGDEILFTPGQGEEHGWIEEILPRRTVCIRPPAANVDRMLIVTAPVPEPDLILVDRLLLHADRQGMEAVIVCNKSDMGPGLGVKLRDQYGGTGIPVLTVSSAPDEAWIRELPEDMRASAGLQALRKRMENGLNCFAGQSGVGKTTLLNSLMGTDMETGELSEKIARGRNTTRRAELLIKNGLRVLDTAGFSLLEFDSVFPPLELKEAWPEFRQYEGSCRFEPCYHDREPGCAVTKACADGMIHPERLERYRKLLQESRESWKDRYH